MEYIIDRFEEDTVVLEDENEEMHNVPVTEMPLGAKEGDVLVYNSDGYIIDVEKTNKRIADMKKLFESLF